MSSNHSLNERLKLGGVVDLLDPAAEGGVRHLQHHREAKLVGGADEIVLSGDDHRRRHGEAVPGHQLVQVDLVGAADHRDRVVDHRHALLHRAAREAVGVVVDRRRLADEQRIELGEPRKVAAGDRLDLDALLLGDPRPVLQGRQVGGRHRLVRIVEDGEGIARSGPVLLGTPFAAGMAVERPVEEVQLGAGELGHRHRGKALDLRPVAVLDGDLEHRTAEPVEEQPAEAVEATILDRRRNRPGGGPAGSCRSGRPAPWRGHRRARASAWA